MVALAFVAFSALDCATTCCALSIGDREQNPFVATLYARDGALGLFLTRAAIVAAVLIALRFLPRRVAAWIALGCTALTALVVLSNVFTITG